ncbi:aspartyl/asparaginyl beta-hydroxylase domain-containing protein [Sphingomonas sp. PR090111-T3T-6A]|uniref:aspartyl/asparaginyl beta-hydroxylase domain-containing protein n=1 Tax=Sphingomonas sp. PR090111-T3T-6A TaxID=685778 RepID=UPI0003A69CD5|nr:aspartyl/asparaginyl beta-hydroxylase domain-containing protein [Sphingomonas sp. PR090111-T3T-6A]
MQGEVDHLLRAAGDALRTGRPEAAQGHWEHVLTIAPAHPEALNGLGMIAFNGGRPGEAAGFFLKAAQAEPEAVVLWLNHARAARAAGDFNAEEQSLLRAVELDPASLIINVRLAESAERSGNPVKAGRYWGAVIASADAMPEVPADARPAVDHARAFLANQNASLESRIADHLASARASIEPRRRRRVEAALDHMFGRRSVYFNQCTGLHIPFLPADEFFDRELFPWFAELERATDMICEELKSAPGRKDEGFEPYVSLPAGTPRNLWSPLDGSMDWSTLHLWRHGVRDDAVCARFPRTAALLDTLPLARLAGRMPTIFFSVLAPGARIPPHTGVTNARAIVHLPLIAPPGCHFRVGGETRTWVKGDAWAFDDTIEHEAWSESDRPRTILIIDCWNPYLSEEEREFLVDFYSASAEAGLASGIGE